MTNSVSTMLAAVLAREGVLEFQQRPVPAVTLAADVLLAVEGYDTGLPAVRAMATAAVVPGPWRSGIVIAAIAALLLLQVACARAATGLALPDSSHDQHADHR